MTVKEIDKTNILDIKVEDYKECGYCQKESDKHRLDIPWQIWSEWQYVSQKMDNKEWGAVFWVKDDTIVKYYIPKQEVGLASCEFLEEAGGDGIVHSHHTMGAFHSGQDDTHARNLYKYSVVISSTGSICTMRSKLPCGGFGHKTVKLFITGMPVIDLDNIVEKTYSGYKVDTATVAVRDVQTAFGYDGLSKNNKDMFIKCDTCYAQDCETCPDYQDYYSQAHPE